MTLNRIVIGGNLVRDPELKQTAQGVSVCSISIAVHRIAKEDKTDFFEVVCWRQGAEYIAKYGRKGDTVVVSGRMQSRDWEDKQGNKRTSWEIVADEVTVVSSKQPTTEQAPVQNQPHMPSAYASQPSVIPGVNAKGGKQMQMQMPLAPPINQQFEEIPNDEGLPF